MHRNAASRLSLLLGTLALALAAPAGRAQLRFDGLSKRHMTEARHDARSVVAADVDRDGDVDLVFGNDLRAARLVLNDGTGVFTEAPAGRVPVPALETTVAIAVGDVDGDGDPDLVHATRRGPILLLRNDGRGRFKDLTASHMPGRHVDSPTDLELVDVDGDGDRDLVSVTYDSGTLLYVNDGRGAFRDVSAARMPVDRETIRALETGDVDGDGDVDLVLGRQSGIFGPGVNALYLNDGGGGFTDVTASHMPPLSLETRDVTLSDVDWDGDPDLVVAPGYEPSRVHLNDGTGRFRESSSARIPGRVPYTRSFAAADVDGDGDEDLLVATSAPGNRLWLNDGSGHFHDAVTGWPRDADRTFDWAWIDADGDGDLDGVAANFLGRNRIYLNDGRGRFTDGTVAPLPEKGYDARRLALGDLDRDGDLDLVHAWASRVHLNDGRGGFTSAPGRILPRPPGASQDVALGDVDGDGDPDLVFAAFGAQNHLMLNHPTGRFRDATAGRMPFDRAPTEAVALGDVDGDGDLDLVFGNRDAQDRLYLNDGSGWFTDRTTTHLPNDATTTVVAAMADVDGDGDPDLLLGGGHRNQLWFNDGSGVFTADPNRRLPATAGRTTGLLPGDLDGDGDPDLVVVTHPFWPSLVLLNDGTGSFTDATAGRLDAHGRGPGLLDDLDGDGDPDLMLLEDGGNHLHLNDGSGFFTDVTATQFPERIFSDTAVAGDLDGDGDPDLVLLGSLGPRLFHNLQSQLHTPHLARAGHRFRIDLYARHRPSPQAVLAYPYVSTGPGRVPMPPAGTFGLDPRGMEALRPVPIPASGRGSVHLDIPADPAVVGTTLYSQALLVRRPGGFTLTNITTDPIVP